MTRLAIFGTGVSAERTWHAISALNDEIEDDLQVVSFADNDPRKQGTIVHGLPVRSAEQVAGSPEIDFVVIASQWHVDITAQLQSLGMAPHRIIAWSVNPGALQDAMVAHRAWRPVRAGGASVDRRQLPKVLILSYETLNDSHGTGVLLKRYFEEFPPDHLFSIAHHASGRPWLSQSTQVTESGPSGIEAIRAALDCAGFRPDVVFATALHETDLALIRDVLAVVPEGTAVVQHFMDFVPHREAAFLAQFAELLPRLTEVWALTEALQTMLAEKAGCCAELVTGLLQRLPRTPRSGHRDAGAGFRTAMVGNFYNPQVVAFIREVWSRARAQTPGLGPVEWYVSPLRVQALLDGGFDPGLDFVWRGFFGGQQLLRKLAEADLGLLALNHEPQATSDYLRYSLPSRLTEFACAGVPLFAVASPDTPLAGFIARHGIGRTSTGPDPARVADDLVAFIHDREARAAAGRAGRTLAERDFRIERFRDWFNGRIVELVWRSRATREKETAACVYW
jgi:hypothetical protein